MNFAIEECDSYYRVILKDFGNLSIAIKTNTNLAVCLGVKIDDFIDATKLYGGFYLKVSNVLRIDRNYALFKSEQDANKFINEYIKPTLLIKKLLQ